MIRIRIDEANKGLLESIREAHEKVEKWPDWKRNVKVSQFSTQAIVLNPGGAMKDGDISGMQLTLRKY